MTRGTRFARRIAGGLAFGLASLAMGCLADHHHHPSRRDTTDEAFEKYFEDRESVPGPTASPTPQPPVQPQPGPGPR